MLFLAGHAARATGAQKIPARSRAAAATASSADCRLGAAGCRVRRYFHRVADDAAAIAQSALHPLVIVCRVVSAPCVDSFDSVAARPGRSRGPGSTSPRDCTGV